MPTKSVLHPILNRIVHTKEEKGNLSRECRERNEGTKEEGETTHCFQLSKPVNT